MANLLKEHVQVNISSNIYLYLSTHIYTGPAGGQLPLPRAARAAHHHRDAQPARHLRRLGCPGQLPSDLDTRAAKKPSAKFSQCQRNFHKTLRIYSNQPIHMILVAGTQFLIYLLWGSACFT